IDAQRQIGSDALLGVAIRDRLRVALDPPAFHCSAQLPLVSRFRSSQTLAAYSDANFGIKGTLAPYDLGAPLNPTFAIGFAARLCERRVRGTAHCAPALTPCQGLGGSTSPIAADGRPAPRPLPS